MTDGAEYEGTGALGVGYDSDDFVAPLRPCSAVGVSDGRFIVDCRKMAVA